MKAKKAILWDFDGVLLDSNTVIEEMLRDTFAKYQLEFPAIDFRSQGLREIITRGAPNESPEKIENMFQHARNLSMKATPRLNLMAGARDVLQNLKDRYRYGIVTMRRRESVLAILESNGIRELFETLVTYDDVVNPKPDPEGLSKAVKELQLTPADALYVGDAEVDILAARSAGVYSVLISQDAEDYGADARLTQVSELPMLLS